MAVEDRSATCMPRATQTRIQGRNLVGVKLASLETDWSAQVTVILLLGCVKCGVSHETKKKSNSGLP